RQIDDQAEVATAHIKGWWDSREPRWSLTGCIRRNPKWRRGLARTASTRGPIRRSRWAAAPTMMLSNGCGQMAVDVQPGTPGLVITRLGLLDRSEEQPK